MTKVIVLGKEDTSKKPIEFIYFIDESGDKQESGVLGNWDVVELVCKNYRNRGLDLMFAYKVDRNGKSNTQQGIYLGHFNDGFVE